MSLYTPDLAFPSLIGLVIGIYGVIVYYNDASPEGALFNNEALPIMGVLLSLW